MKHWRIGEESLHDSTRSPYGVETIYMSLSTFPMVFERYLEIMSLVLKCPTNNTVCSHCEV